MANDPPRTVIDFPKVPQLPKLPASIALRPAIGAVLQTLEDGTDCTFGGLEPLREHVGRPHAEADCGSHGRGASRKGLSPRIDADLDRRLGSV